MTASLQEIKNEHEQCIAAMIWANPKSHDIEAIKMAKTKLMAYISEYVGRKPHNVFYHTESDTVSAVVIFDMNNYPSHKIDI